MGALEAETEQHGALQAGDGVSSQYYRHARALQALKHGGNTAVVLLSKMVPKVLLTFCPHPNVTSIRIINTRNVLLWVVIDFLLLNVCSVCNTVAVERHVTPRIISHCHSAVLYLLLISHGRTM